MCIRDSAEGSSQEVRDAADKINRYGIHEMLKLETPNLHEIGLDRVIACVILPISKEM